MCFEIVGTALLVFTVLCASDPERSKRGEHAPCPPPYLTYSARTQHTMMPPPQPLNSIALCCAAIYSQVLSPAAIGGAVFLAHLAGIPITGAPCPLSCSRRRQAAVSSPQPVPLAFLDVTPCANLGGTLASAGTSINPARSLGPAVVSNTWHLHWVYWVGPISGAIVAVIVFNLLRLPPPREGERSELAPPTPSENIGVYGLSVAEVATGGDGRQKAQGSSGLPWSSTAEVVEKKQKQTAAAGVGGGSDAAV